MDTSVRNIWKPELYRIQLEAPKPTIIPCDNNNQHRTSFYGREYHGIMSHKEASMILDQQPNGAFLIRKGRENNDFFTLTWRFNNRIQHFKLYYDGKHYVREIKKYDTIYDLVADGLVSQHMEENAQHVIRKMHETTTYTESPYVTLNRRKLKALSSKNNLESNLLNVASDILYQKESQSHVKPDVNTSQTFDNGQIGILTKDNLLVDKYLKAHNFKVHTFKGLNWCELCANFLWGFTAQGVKCEDCGFIAHSKCSEQVPNHCLPDLKKVRGVFGIDLTTLLNVRSSTLPFVVRKCVLEIEHRGMDSEGIYRVSGFADEIEALKMAFDGDGESADLQAYSNINVVAGALKLYLRLLPVPLITYDVHPHLLKCNNAKNPQEQVLLIRDCLSLLPPAHYNCLQYMIQHLHRVSLRAAENKMSAYNLSTVFAPTLVATPPVVTDLAPEIHSLQALIQYCPTVYGNSH